MMSDEERKLIEDSGNETEETPAEAKGEAEAERETREPDEATPATTSGPIEATPTANERTWAALAHASVLLTFALGVSTGGLATVVMALVPLLIWLTFRDRSRFVAFHAMQATVFQLGVLALWIGLLVAGLVILIPTWILTALLLVILVGLLLLPLALVLTIILPIVLAALPFASLVYGLYGAYEVYAGRTFRYWLVADWIEGQEMKTT